MISSPGVVGPAYSSGNFHLRIQENERKKKKKGMQALNDLQALQDFPE